MANKSGKPRTCSVCQETGHNSRTCPMRGSRVSDSGKDLGSSADLSSHDVAREGGSTGALPHVPRDRASVPPGGEVLEPQERHEPVSFAGRVIQEHINGVTYRLTSKEYQMGATTFDLKIIEDTQTKDVQFDLEGAGKIVQLLSGVLQEIAAKKQQRAMPIVRSNGIVPSPSVPVVTS